MVRASISCLDGFLIGRSCSRLPLGSGNRLRMAGRRPNEAVTPEDAQLILRLRLLIARAANSDSLAWWDDDTLTLHAEFLLERIFPMAPALAARSLALAAAAARHQAACPDDSALHLYRLDADKQDELAVRSVPLLPIPLPADPITTMDALRQHLLDLVGEPAPYTVVRETSTHGLQVKAPSSPPYASPMVHRARTLAWAYLEGAPGEPVFPFCLE